MYTCSINFREPKILGAHKLFSGVDHIGSILCPQVSLRRRMDFTSSSITVRISSWKWAFQPYQILVWPTANFNLILQICIPTLSNRHPVIRLQSSDMVRISTFCICPRSNWYPARLECSFSGWYPDCDGWWGTIHPTPEVFLSQFHGSTENTRKKIKPNIS